MSPNYLLTEIRDRVGYITLNRAEKKNALNDDMVSELTEAFSLMYKDSQVKVIQLRAMGDVFSAGADLHYLQKLQVNSFEENFQDSKLLANLFNLIYSGPKVVVSVVQGHAIAGGCGLATVCDFCIAVPEAKFGYTEVKIGFVPAIVMIFLIKKLGETRARDLTLTGKLISAVEAQSIGLINEVIKQSELQIRADAFCKHIAASSSAESIQRIKQMFTQIYTMNLEEALLYAAKQNAETRSTEDCKKGISSFLNKERINW